MDKSTNSMTIHAHISFVKRPEISGEVPVSQVSVKTAAS